MIKKFAVEKLRGFPSEKAKFDFKPGLNILTGKNGSGKTTLMKVIWYLTSGNIERATVETPFSRATVETDDYEMVVECRGTQSVKITIHGSDITREFEQEFDDDGDVFFDNIEEDANQATMAIGSSVYFPTFRRIEGGYAIQPRTGDNRSRRPSDVEGALNEVSRTLSNSKHQFVCSVSATDISRLIIQRYSDLSDGFNVTQGAVSQSVINQIKQFESKPEPQADGDPARAVLEDVKRTIEALDIERERIFQPITAIRRTVETIFKSKSISFGSRLSFGDAALAVSSDSLSAGEKQMLSFICYNALIENSTFFIDEPELSLHPDWQRELFRVLEEQGSGNQFLIATHSPFIYSRYPEREIRIDTDRGDDLVSE